MSNNLAISKVTLINAPELDINYNHTVDFNSLENQINWFRRKAKHTLNECKYVKTDMSLIIDLYIENPKLLNSNYVMIENQESNTIEYGFIVKREYVNEYNSKIYIKKDVIQSNLFKINLSNTESFIEQAHVNRYNQDNSIAYDNMTEPEDIEAGFYRILNDGIKNVYDYSSTGGGYIITSSQSLTKANGGGSGTRPPSGTGSLENWKDGLVSEKGYLFIKGFEGFSATPYADSGGVMTIGYGTTFDSDHDAYVELSPECTEEEASIVFARRLDEGYARTVKSDMLLLGINATDFNQNMFDALVSLCYNAGPLRCRTILTKIKNGESKNSIADFWKTFIIKDSLGNELDGLKARRQAEADIFLNGNYSIRPIENLNGGVISENDGKGYVPERYIVNIPTASGIRENIVNSALSLVGKPYRYGGNYPPLGNSDGTDCSGLIQWSYYVNGFTDIINYRTTYDQITMGIEVSLEDAMPGDLVFMGSNDNRGYPSHVVMFISNNGNGSIHVVEAKGTDYGIIENDRVVGSDFRYRNLLSNYGG